MKNQGKPRVSCVLPTQKGPLFAERPFFGINQLTAGKLRKIIVSPVPCA